MTVGNMAANQVRMAQVTTKYGSQLDSLYNSYQTTNSKNSLYGVKKGYGSEDQLSKLLESNMFKGKSSQFKDAYAELYRNIFGMSNPTDSTSSSSPQAIKAITSEVGGKALGLQNYANGLKYGEIDTEAYKTQAQSFIDSYNSMIDKLGDAENGSVLQQGVFLVNQAKVYSSSLGRAGITLGSDNKLTLKDDLSGVDALDVKTAFGSASFADKLVDRVGKINVYSGGNGVFTPASGAAGSTGTTSAEEMKNNLEQVKASAGKLKTNSDALKEYIKEITNGDTEFNVEDYTKAAKSFIDSYNDFMSESQKSPNFSVNSKGNAIRGISNSYKFALERAGFEVGKNGQIKLGDTSKLDKNGLQYAFNSSYLDRVNAKANEVNALVAGTAMGYTNSGTSYAYTSGAIYSNYA